MTLAGKKAAEDMSPSQVHGGCCQDVIDDSITCTSVPINTSIQNETPAPPELKVHIQRHTHTHELELLYTFPRVPSHAV